MSAVSSTQWPPRSQTAIPACGDQTTHAATRSTRRYLLTTRIYRPSVASEAICKRGGGGHAGRIFFWCAPTFLLCPTPHMRGYNDCLLPTERQLKCPLVSALQSAHEVGRRAIKVMGAHCCALQTSQLLEIDHSVWKQSYNACPTILYSIDIGSVSVFTVQIDDTSDATDVSK